jgi:sugar phosphate isomerase/epimerase
MWSDAVQAIRKWKDRLVAVHVKDLHDTGAIPTAKWGTVYCPIRDILKALKAGRYPGGLSLEYEAEPENPMAGMKHLSLTCEVFRPGLERNAVGASSDDQSSSKRAA